MESARAHKFAKSEKENNKRRVIVVLENAYLETVKSKKTEGAYELLNCDDHIHTLKKLNRDFSEARPDIVHQVQPFILLSSPLLLLILFY
jgi:rRNA small subunit pseudouridine methyltransferase Nep1